MILCCGEALIDMLPRKSAGGGMMFMPAPGGAVFNTATALGRLGGKAGYFGGLSDDFFGDMLRESLGKSGVDTSLAPHSSRPTTLAFVQLENGQARYVFYDENTAGRMLGPNDLPPLPASVNAVFFGGISIAAEPCGLAFETLMLREAATRATMLDPNIRPGFIGDEAAYRARLSQMIAAADMVKVSDEDLRWMTGHAALKDGVRTMLETGARIVLLTQGSKGARAFTRDLEISVRAQPVEVVDTVGAGDTFNAGVLAALDEAGLLSKPALATISADALRAALETGVRAAAVTVSRAGANPPWKEEL